ncbi:pilus assembly PilX family protein [Pseudomonas capsici]|uniref:PilX N-terminal domain-containing pilus assembly protein n=1 Tax=Pseudomonas capsici TaxID=2810614 RepID=A0ABT3C3X8_9PSED|nr:MULTISPECIES: PilX N-terminal domain-containing pilus assembly protein [Pseudomonas]MBN6712925.1 pilus assembly protein PilX [Pseudomonas capsici]MBN6717917.1 pilus assembly protein PilX [Pseudomonas capsici]MBN6722375.1 pilus assembly protein PilX [Pseudomonas capsici]MBX8473408.1 pilus assembly protein PilX [Pseudomonas cichorii]MCV4270844.1 PilX N-terminal domain-containing pilus assembly protein [Pseudomonas capsici]
MNSKRFCIMPAFPARQSGMVLLVSLVFLLLLTLLGISSMQNATLQEKMAGSVALRNQSFQKAEAALRLGESSIRVVGFTLAKCTTNATCAPPAESTTLTAAGTNGTSGVSWVAAGGGFYGIQNLGTTATPIKRPPTCTGTVTLYRVTSVAIQGTSRTVLESIYANC